MSVCGMPGCGSTAEVGGGTCKLHHGLDRYIPGKSVQQHPQCPFCGTRHRRSTLDDACASEWAAGAKYHTAQVDSTAQPAPKPSTGPALWDLVERDMQGRDNFGKHKYGVRLQAHNGRDFLVDAYQEALDLVVYLRGVIYERDGK